MLDKEKVREIALKYSEKVRETLNPAKIILFGSYVNGNPHEWSDIDIAVLVSDITDDDWYNARILLWGIKGDFIDDFIDVEPHLLNPEHDPSGFVEHVVKTGEVIYKSA
jgi:predicted nucleotidyltransferase